MFYFYHWIFVWPGIYVVQGVRTAPVCVFLPLPAPFTCASAVSLLLRLCCLNPTLNSVFGSVSGLSLLFHSFVSRSMFKNHSVLCIVTLEYALVLGEAIELMDLSPASFWPFPGGSSPWELQRHLVWVIKIPQPSPQYWLFKKKLGSPYIYTLLKNWHRNNVLFKNRGIITHIWTHFSVLFCPFGAFWHMWTLTCSFQLLSICLFYGNCKWDFPPRYIFWLGD